MLRRRLFVRRLFAHRCHYSLAFCFAQESQSNLSAIGARRERKSALSLNLLEGVGAASRSAVVTGDFAMWDWQPWISWLASIPVLGTFIDWLAALPRLQPWDLLREVVDAFLRLLGFSEFIKWVYRKFFGSKLDLLTRKIEVLEEELRFEGKSVENTQKQLAEINQTLRETREASLEHAIIEAEKERRDGNEAKAGRVLDKWLKANSDRLGDLSVAMAKFHIGQAVPDPGEHVSEARRLLILAQAVAPHKSEATRCGPSSISSAECFKKKRLRPKARSSVGTRKCGLIWSRQRCGISRGTLTVTAECSLLRCSQIAQP
jgi:hypothetical protein